MVDYNFVDAVIQLPSDLFFGTSIATCILVLKKSKKTNDILFIDASNEFIRPTNKNKLSPDNINWIIEKIKNRKGNKNEPVLVVTNEEVEKNNYNISVNTYIKNTSEEEKIDIKEINEKIKNVVKRGNEIRKELDKIILELEENNE